MRNRTSLGRNFLELALVAQRIESRHDELCDARGLALFAELRSCLGLKPFTVDLLRHSRLSLCKHRRPLLWRDVSFHHCFKRARKEAGGSNGHIFFAFVVALFCRLWDKFHRRVGTLSLYATSC